MTISNEEPMRLTISEIMSALGKKSAEKRKAKGNVSDYYRKLVNKRWGKRKAKR